MVELNRIKPENNTNLQNKGYFTIFYQKLIELILSIIIPNHSEEDEDDSWTLSKASSYLLKLLVQITNIEVLRKLIEFIITNLELPDPLTRIRCIYILEAVLETNQKDYVASLINNKINIISKMFLEDNIQIKYAISGLFYKIVKLYGKVVSKSIWNLLVPVFLNGMSYNIKIAINMCRAITNLIKGFGDITTNKNTSKFDLLINRFYFTSL